MKKTVIASALCAVTAVALFTGCASSTNSAEQSGFLGDYSDLKEGSKGEAQYVYINEQADFTQYTKVRFAPITVWRTEDSKLDELDDATAQELANALFASVYEALKDDYEIVNENGADTMLIRIALTEAVGAKRVMNSVSTVIPVGLVASVGTKAVTGSHAFVGKASVEMEILDSVTSERLAAAVDERAGSKGVEAEWTQVKKAFDYWANGLKDRLQRLNRASRMKESLIDVVI
ncbi:MAG: DUF3313 domain-containing protein [Coraliomargarita sp.]